MVWLSDGEKSLDMITRFDTIHKRDVRTDGQTPRDGIGRACVASRFARQKRISYRLYCKPIVSDPFRPFQLLNFIIWYTCCGISCIGVMLSLLI